MTNRFNHISIYDRWMDIQVWKIFLKTLLFLVLLVFNCQKIAIGTKLEKCGCGILFLKGIIKIYLRHGGSCFGSKLN